MEQLSHLVRKRPMVLITSLFMIGLVIGDQFRITTWVALTIALIFLFLALILPANWKLTGFCLIIVSLGLLDGSLQRLMSVGHLSNFRPELERSYHLVALVGSVGETRRGTPKYILDPISMDSSVITDGSIILYAKDLEDIPNPGDTVECDLTLQFPRGMRNPNEFDYAAYLRGQNIYFEAFLDQDGSFTVMRHNGLRVGDWIQALTGKIQNQFLRHISQRSTAILSALILGLRGDVDEDIRTDFANTGVIHVLAVSGLHVGYVSLILIVATGFLRLGPTFKVTFIIAGLCFYVVLTGGAASVQRASLMGILIVLAGRLERKTDVLNILASAAFIMLLVDPAQLSNLGFQLSFSAVISIVTLFPVLQVQGKQLVQRLPSAFRKGAAPIMDLFLVSLAAQLGTLPITIYYFQKLPVISLMANMVVVPLIGLIVAVGMSFLILGWMSTFMASSWGALLDGLIQFLLWFVHACSTVSWAFLSTSFIDLLQVAILLTAIFSIAFISLKRWVKLGLILLLLWMNYALWPGLLKPQVLEVVMLDVGQGDAILLHTPNDKTILIDAGLRFGGRDMGADVIWPYMQHRNWGHIDLMVLTHPHNDHMGGAEFLVQNMSVGEVIMSDIEYDSYGYHQLVKTLEALNIPWRPSYSGGADSSCYPLVYRVLAPKHSPESPSNVNNASIVLQCFYGETSLLFTGDAELEVEAYEIHYGSLLRSDLLKAPHHGSRTSSSAAFFEQIQPDISLISVETGNKYKHPSPSTLARYEAGKTIIHRTDLEGAVIYHSNGDSLKYFDWRRSEGF